VATIAPVTAGTKHVEVRQVWDGWNQLESNLDQKQSFPVKTCCLVKNSSRENYCNAQKAHFIRKFRKIPDVAAKMHPEAKLFTG